MIWNRFRDFCTFTFCIAQSGNWVDASRSELPPGSPRHPEALVPSAPLIPSITHPGAPSLVMEAPSTGMVPLVLNPFYPIHPGAVLPHHFFPSEVCSAACSRHTSCQHPFPLGCAWLGTATDARLCCPWHGDHPCQNWLRRQLLLNAQRDNLGFYFPPSFSSWL